MIITIAFDILSRNVEGVGISPFKLFSYSGFVVLPGGLSIILFQNKIGRKGMACASLLVGAFITATTGYLVGTLDPANYSVLLGFMVCLARFGAVVAYDAEAQYAAEIIPTSVRGRGVANIHVVGNAFAFFSSYIIYLGTFYKPLPSLLISFLLIIGACLCLTLPETLHKWVFDNLFHIFIYNNYFILQATTTNSRGGRNIRQGREMVLFPLFFTQTAVE